MGDVTNFLVKSCARVSGVMFGFARRRGDTSKPERFFVWICEKYRDTGCICVGWPLCYAIK